MYGPRGFEALPLREGGACGGVPDPITVAVAFEADARVATIWGRGTGDVTSIVARTGGRTMRLPLQLRSTYIAVLEDFDGASVELEVRLRGGGTRVVRTQPFPPPPTAAELERLRSR